MVAEIIDKCAKLAGSFPHPAVRGYGIKRNLSPEIFLSDSLISQKHKVFNNFCGVRFCHRGRISTARPFSSRITFVSGKSKLMEPLLPLPGTYDARKFFHHLYHGNKRFILLKFLLIAVRAFWLLRYNSFFYPPGLLSPRSHDPPHLRKGWTVIMQDRASLSSPAFREQIPLESLWGSMGITRSAR